MKFSVLMLADHAAVADGLLYVNGGCVNAIMRPDFPSPLGVMLAAAVVVPVESLNTAVQLTLSMHAVGDEKKIFQVDVEFVASIKEGRDRLPFENAFVVDLRPAPVPAPGNYVLEARIGETVHQLYFAAIESNLEADEEPR